MKGLLLCLAGLVAQFGAYALPVDLDKRAISSSLLSQLAFYEQYAAAAYCPADNSGPIGSKIACSSGNCPQVQSASTASIVEFQNQGIVDGTGFVAVDNTNKLIVIAYRGSHSVVNFLTDSQFGQLPYLCFGCFIHAGFLSSWLQTKTAVTNAVASALAAHPGYAIVATGHSLGAAIATIAAAELRSKYPVALYTYGSPMVGNSVFATYVTNQSGGNYRVTHQQDVVPQLPGYLLLDYRHVSPQYWITSGNGAGVTTNDVKQSSGIADISGDDTLRGVSISNHLWYFNAIAGCAPDTLEIG